MVERAELVTAALAAKVPIVIGKICVRRNMFEELKVLATASREFDAMAVTKQILVMNKGSVLVHHC